MASGPIAWLLALSAGPAAAQEVGDWRAAPAADLVASGAGSRSGLANALQQATTHEVDALGRVVATTDANGVERRTTLDAWGRELTVSLRPAGSPVAALMSETVWHDEDLPRWSETRRMHRAAGSVTETTSYAVFDGFGREVQRWEPSAADGYVVTGAETDARGVSRWSAEPEVRTAVFTGAYTRGGTLRSYVWADLFGEVVTSFDRDLG